MDEEIVATKVFIDGSAGTTGLRIVERLSARDDIELLSISPELRKDPAARAELMNAADVVFLCLPDAAAIEAVGFIENPDTVVIDTSTAHRTAEGWMYGFPEVVGADAVAASKRIANPGCHASGFVALVAPLVQAGLVPADAALSVTSITGYSGGGKSMIAQYEGLEAGPLFDAPRLYALSQEHKHLAEMQKICGLEQPPAFMPFVAPYYAGMEVAVPLNGLGIPSVQAAHDAYAAFYEGACMVSVVTQDEASEEGFLSAKAFEGLDTMQICVTGNDERPVSVARFDNLGKGASGAAIQNMNIVIGAKEDTGLVTNG